MSNRPLNFAGYSLETRAAIYESDAAAREAYANPLDESAQAYWQSAWRAEKLEHDLDADVEDSDDPRYHPHDCCCIYCIPGA